MLGLFETSKEICRQLEFKILKYIESTEKKLRIRSLGIYQIDFNYVCSNSFIEYELNMNVQYKNWK